MDNILKNYYDLRDQMVQRIRKETANWRTGQFQNTSPIFFTRINIGDFTNTNVLYVVEKIRSQHVEARLFIKNETLFGNLRYVPCAEHSRFSFDELDAETLRRIGQCISIEW